MPRPKQPQDTTHGATDASPAQASEQGPRGPDHSQERGTGAATEGETNYALLRDGTVVAIRPARESDEEEVYRLHAELTPESRRFRFFIVPSNAALRVHARRICRTGVPGRGALVAAREDRVVGAAQYEPTPVPGRAEVSLAVADDTHGQGVGTLLLEHLASHARRNGVGEFKADVLLTNHDMIGVFAAAGLPLRRQVSQGEMQVTFPLTADEDYLTATHKRESQADRASLSGLLRPRSVAVVGASRRTASVGNTVLRNIRDGGFTGSLYAVNPRAAHVDGVPSFPSVARLPETPELVMVAVPEGAVLDVAQECAHRGVRGLVIITAGLDTETRDALRRLCRRHDMRLVGPNCFGLGNTEEGVRLDATFGAAPPARGGAGVVVQSGGVGITLREHLSRLDVGVSSFVSLGDKLDVSGNDLLMWWYGEESTRLGVLYLESFGNPRKFSWLARQVGRRIPLLTVVAGRSEPGRRAAASHTAAAATPARTTQALFHQAGIVTTRDLGELVDTAGLLGHQPLPRGGRVGIVSNAGGAGVLAADACVAAGLTVPRLDAATRRRLAKLLPARAECANPVDTGADATPRQLRAAVRTVLSSPEVDAVIVLLVATGLADPDPATMAPPPSLTGKPLLAVSLGQAPSVAVHAVSDGPALPCYGDPTAAARALGNAWGYARWRSRPPGEFAKLPDIAADAAQCKVAAFLDEHSEGGWLPARTALEICDDYGIATVPWRWAGSAAEAAEAAALLGRRVALKGEVDGIVHKSQAGALLLDLEGAAGAEEGYRVLQDRFGPRLRGVLVQSMAAPGLELLFGVHHDPVFGPVLVYGLGGVHADSLDLREARLTPLTLTDAAELIATLAVTTPGGPDGEGRAGPSLPTQAVQHLEGVAVRLSRLATDLPQVRELDLNPVLVNDAGVVALDVRIRVEPALAADPYLRRLG